MSGRRTFGKTYQSDFTLIAGRHGGAGPMSTRRTRRNPLIWFAALGLAAMLAACFEGGDVETGGEGPTAVQSQALDEAPEGATEVWPTDSTATIQAAIDAGGVVYFHAGHYNITERLRIEGNVTLTGAPPVPHPIDELHPTGRDWSGGAVLSGWSNVRGPESDEDYSDLERFDQCVFKSTIFLQCPADENVRIENLLLDNTGTPTPVGGCASTYYSVIQLGVNDTGRRDDHQGDIKDCDPDDDGFCLNRDEWIGGCDFTLADVKIVQGTGHHAYLTVSVGQVDVRTIGSEITTTRSPSDPGGSEPYILGASNPTLIEIASSYIASYDPSPGSDNFAAWLPEIRNQEDVPAGEVLLRDSVFHSAGSSLIATSVLNPASIQGNQFEGRTFWGSIGPYAGTMKENVFEMNGGAADAVLIVGDDTTLMTVKDNVWTGFGGRQAIVVESTAHDNTIKDNDLTTYSPVLENPDYVSGCWLDGEYFAGAEYSSPFIVPTAGRFAETLDFTGSDFIRIEDTDRLTPEHITISAWILPSAQQQDFLNHIVAKWGGPGDNSYEILLWDEYLRYQVVNSDGISRFIDGGVWIPGIWNHVVMTYDGQYVAAYLNGVFLGEECVDFDEATGTCRSGVVNNSATSVNIGASRDGTAFWFTGAIDDFSMWDEALTSDEVQLLWNDGDGRAASSLDTSGASGSGAALSAYYTLDATDVVPVVLNPSFPDLEYQVAIDRVGYLPGDNLGESPGFVNPTICPDIALSRAEEFQHSSFVAVGPDAYGNVFKDNVYGPFDIDGRVRFGEPGTAILVDGDGNTVKDETFTGLPGFSEPFVSLDPETGENVYGGLGAIVLAGHDNVVKGFDEVCTMVMDLPELDAAKDVLFYAAGALFDLTPYGFPGCYQIFGGAELRSYDFGFAGFDDGVPGRSQRFVRADYDVLNDISFYDGTFVCGVPETVALVQTEVLTSLPFGGVAPESSPDGVPVTESDPDDNVIEGIDECSSSDD